MLTRFPAQKFSGSLMSMVPDEAALFRGRTETWSRGDRRSTELSTRIPAGEEERPTAFHTNLNTPGSQIFTQLSNKR